MGTQAAPKEIPEGVISAIFCIENVPFDGGNEWNGKFVGDNCEVWDYWKYFLQKKRIY